MGKMKQMLLEMEERRESIQLEDMQPTLSAMLDGELRKEILAIVEDHGSRMNWRRDDLRRFFKDRNINITFTMAELRSIIKE